MDSKNAWLERNRHPDGRLYNIQFGLCQIADGLVRVLSGGFAHTRLTLNLARKRTRKRIEKLKAQ